MKRPSPKEATRNARRQDHSALRVLTTGALALTGVAGKASADTPVDRVYADYNYSVYSEDDIAPSKVLATSARERYEIEMHQFLFQSPVPWTESWDFGVEIVSETMSGASPLYLFPDAALQPIQVMSGATIKEERTDILLNMNHYYENARVGFGAGYSTENDYTALNFSFDGETHFNEKNTTLSGGLAVSLDDIEPTDANLVATRPSSEEKKTYSLFAGLSQVIDRRSVIQTSLAYKHHTGYLDDPYKQMLIFTGVLFRPDTRPDTRNQFSWLTRFRRHIEEVNGTLHGDYQFYFDDWGVDSHTFEVAWHQGLWDSLLITPSIRYYSQTEADFFIPFFITAQPLGTEASNDYRLSAYGALSWGIKGEYTFRTRWTGGLDWRLTAGWERYKSSSEFALDDGSVEHPGLLDYDVWTLGFSFRY